MAVPQKINVKHYRGDSLGLQVRLWADVDKTEPVDLAGAVVRAVVRYVIETRGREEVFAVAVDANTIDLGLLPTQTSRLPSTCHWDCQVTWPAGSVQTVAYGDMTFIGEVTS